MGRLSERIATARRAVATLRELAEKPRLTLVERDALLQRFEYSVEAVWKTVQLHLREQEGIDAGSPKAVARASLQTRLLSDEQVRAALLMIEDRNHGAHLRGAARERDRWEGAGPRATPRCLDRGGGRVRLRTRSVRS